MEHVKTDKPSLTLLGLGNMGAALARAWLAAGHPLTVWNRTPAKAKPLTAEGAHAAPTPAEAVAANTLIVVCLLDDASVGETLNGVDLTGKDLVNLTTGTPAQARARAEWAQSRGARFLDGGIMAVPPMIGDPDSGGYIFYSGSQSLVDTHRATLTAATGANYVGSDPGFAALHDVALLSAMTGMFAGISHAFALIRKENISPKAFAPLLLDWLTAMAHTVHETADHLETGDYTKNVVSNLAMMVEGNKTLLHTANEQGVSTELLTPYTNLMERRLSEGHPDEDTTGVIDLLARP
jgi:3-hydroxyisobutyrate dehydrogenase-like beta-hydroxyacid dehydrogenase